MARIPYPDPATQSEELRDKLRRLGSLNVTRMISHSEGALSGYARLGTFLLRKGKLDPVVREAVILRIGQLCGSEYEWHQHVSVARAVGMSEETITAISNRDFTALDPRSQAALRVAEEIKSLSGATGEAIGRAKEHFTDEELVELCLVAGYYIMTAGLLLSLAVEIEQGAPLGASIHSDS